MSSEQMNQITSIRMSRGTASRLAIIKQRLGFKSIEQLLKIYERATVIQNWTKEDLLIMATSIETGTAGSDKELREKLKAEADSLHQLFVQAKQKTKVKAKKKAENVMLKGINDE